MFAIIESGRRISLPIDRLLRGELTVTPAAATAGVRDASAPSASTAAPGRHAGRIDAYRNAAEPPPRRPLRIAAELMSSPVRTLRGSDTVAQAWQLLLTGRFHHLPIVDEQGALAGILSDRDLLRAAARDPAANGWPLADLMQPRVIVAAPQTSLRALAEVMTARRIGAMPIVDELARPVGMVSRTDLLRALVGQAPIELWG